MRARRRSRRKRTRRERTTKFGLRTRAGRRENARAPRRRIDARWRTRGRSVRWKRSTRARGCAWRRTRRSICGTATRARRRRRAPPSSSRLARLFNTISRECCERAKSRTCVARRRCSRWRDFRVGSWTHRSCDAYRWRGSACARAQSHYGPTTWRCTTCTVPRKRLWCKRTQECAMQKTKARIGRGKRTKDLPACSSWMKCAKANWRCNPSRRDAASKAKLPSAVFASQTGI
mmetsp:Transcript_4698/g.17969  ORF Transcript_4698/g.17969 Transcript_4698/m.17969 type:complete len:233 (-) Transcript_4698:5319-6017(-)